MADRMVYLKQNVMLEPLFNQWYAWSHLISPPNAAMYMANSHLKIMQSFLNSPQIHVSALKNPAMVGGPFINYDPARAPEIRELMDRTLKDHAPMFQFAEAIKELDQKLSEEALGYSLEPYYQNVPEILRGYVELIYDLNNRPSIRFIEGLLYKSEFYNEASQAIALSPVNGDDRSFVFSTPRLKEPERLILNIPFKQRELDSLFEMKSSAKPCGLIKEMLGVENDDEAFFSSLFSDQAPPAADNFNGDDVRVRYFGHACVLIESAGVSILSDPTISYKYEDGIERFTYADLPDHIDYALITHNHQDHCQLETLLQLRHKIKTLIVPKSASLGLADPCLELALQNTGFKCVIDMDEMESISIGSGSITSLPFLGEHADLNIRTKTAYLVNIKGRSILLAADSNNIEPKLYEHIGNLIGKADVVFLGMECDGAPLSWIYGALLTRPLHRQMDQSRRFNGSDYQKAIDIVERLKCDRVYVYAMGQEPWLNYFMGIAYTKESRPIIESDKLVDECRRRGIEAERLFGKKEFFLKAK